MKTLIIFLFIQVYASQCKVIVPDQDIEIKNDETSDPKEELLDDLLKPNNNNDDTDFLGNAIDDFLDLKTDVFSYPHKKNTSLLNNPRKHINNVIRRITDRGAQMLTEYTEFLQLKLNTVLPIPFKLQRLDDYIKNTHDHTKNVKKALKYKVYKVDMDYLMLDLLESLYNMLFIEINKVQDEVLKNKNVTENHLEVMRNNLRHRQINEKKEYLSFICLKYHTCRPYPAFSDYFVDLISEILTLPMQKLTVIAKNFTESIKVNQDFFKMTIKEDMLDAITKKLDIHNDKDKLRDFLTNVKSNFVKKYNLPHWGDAAFRNREKASKMIIEIIDRTIFDAEADLTYVSFATLTEEVRRFGLDLTPDINEILHFYTNRFTNFCKYQWDERVVDDINILLQIILFGKAKDDLKQEVILSKGPIYSRGSME